MNFGRTWELLRLESGQLVWELFFDLEIYFTGSSEAYSWNNYKTRLPVLLQTLPEESLSFPHSSKNTAPKRSYLRELYYFGDTLKKKESYIGIQGSKSIFDIGTDTDTEKTC